jgi:phospholipase/lecithinase/hemolysin
LKQQTSLQHASIVPLIRLSPGFAGRAGLRLYRLDVWQLAERVRADPAAAGFVDIASPCSQHRRCEGYLFWDDVHPTTQAHRRLADAAAQVLEAP